jgi:hypothetical protein
VEILASAAEASTAAGAQDLAHPSTNQGGRWQLRKIIIIIIRILAVGNFERLLLLSEF